LTGIGALLGAGGAYLLAQAYRQARTQCPPFARRTFHSAPELIAAFAAFWRYPQRLVSLRANPHVAGPFALKIMLAVSGANGCRYGGYAHGRYALRHGLGRAEVDSLLRGEVDAATIDEAPALYFAQQYVAQDGHPDDDLAARLSESYGERTARDLRTLIQFVTLGNRVGNTADALLSRLLGQPASQSTLRGELQVVLTFALGIAPLIAVLGYRVRQAERGTLLARPA
jgi:AhpD family alkylhydroperoxidase